MARCFLEVVENSITVYEQSNIVSKTYVYVFVYMIYFIYNLALALPFESMDVISRLLEMDI